MKISVNNIPAEIQEMLDNGVNFREIEDALRAYEKLRLVENYASAKGVPNFIDIDWEHFYDFFDCDEDSFNTAKQLDEKYGIMNLIELQDEYNDL
jgi:predicted helicase